MSKLIKRADPSTIQDKFLVGYQGWFTCAGDGPPIGPGHHGWLHWFNYPIPDGGRPNTDLWPETSSYSPEELFPAPGITLPNGETAKLFSSRHPKTVQRHFHWMAESGVDGALLQRFAGQTDMEGGHNAGIRNQRDEIGDRVREAAEAEGRVFAIMYDVSGVAPDKIQRVLEADWVHLLKSKKVLESPAYLKEKGKPVVVLWGFGFEDSNHDPETLRAITKFFRSETPGGAYIMAGTPAHWRTATSDASRDTAFLDIWLNEFDALSPWTIGRFNSEPPSELDRFYKDRVLGDWRLISKRNEARVGSRQVDYIPVVLPGGSGFNLSEGKWSFNGIPRKGGRFLYEQLHRCLVEVGVRTVYGAMWDEYDEGTALMPVVEKTEALPTSAKWKFLALDADGIEVPGDWYMRICGFVAEALRKERTLSKEFPLKDLEEWVKYQDASPGAGTPATGGKMGKEEEDNEAMKGYQQWLKNQKEKDDDPPPPPYTMEFEEVGEQVPAATTSPVPMTRQELQEQPQVATSSYAGPSGSGAGPSNYGGPSPSSPASGPSSAGAGSSNYAGTSSGPSSAGAGASNHAAAGVAGAAVGAGVSQLTHAFSQHRISPAEANSYYGDLKQGQAQAVDRWNTNGGPPQGYPPKQGGPSGAQSYPPPQHGGPSGSQGYPPQQGGPSGSQGYPPQQGGPGASQYPPQGQASQQQPGDPRPTPPPLHPMHPQAQAQGGANLQRLGGSFHGQGGPSYGPGGRPPQSQGGQGGPGPSYGPPGPGYGAPTGPGGSFPQPGQGYGAPTPQAGPSYGQGLGVNTAAPGRPVSPYPQQPSTPFPQGPPGNHLLGGNPPPGGARPVSPYPQPSGPSYPTPGGGYGSGGPSSPAPGGYPAFAPMQSSNPPPPQPHHPPYHHQSTYSQPQVQFPHGPPTPQHSYDSYNGGPSQSMSPTPMQMGFPAGPPGGGGPGYNSGPNPGYPQPQQAPYQGGVAPPPPGPPPTNFPQYQGQGPPRIHMPPTPAPYPNGPAYQIAPGGYPGQVYAQYQPQQQRPSGALGLVDSLGFAETRKTVEKMFHKFTH